MERSPFSLQHYRHRKGVPDIPHKPRTIVSPDWSDEIKQLETFFSSITLPLGAFKLNTWTTITDLQGCVESELAYAKANNGNRTFRSHIDRLHEIKQKLSPDTQEETQKNEVDALKDQHGKKMEKTVSSTYQII